MNSTPPSLDACVREQLERYFHDLDGESAGGVWQMVVSAVERPMLEVVLDKAGGNQSRAADILGINRNTLRKRLSELEIEPDRFIRRY